MITHSLQKYVRDAIQQQTHAILSATTKNSHKKPPKISTTFSKSFLPASLPKSKHYMNIIGSLQYYNDPSDQVGGDVFRYTREFGADPVCRYDFFIPRANVPSDMVEAQAEKVFAWNANDAKDIATNVIQALFETAVVSNENIDFNNSSTRAVAGKDRIVFATQEYTYAFYGTSSGIISVKFSQPIALFSDDNVLVYRHCFVGICSDTNSNRSHDFVAQLLENTQTKYCIHLANAREENEEGSFFMVGVAPNGAFMLNEFDLSLKQTQKREEFLLRYNMNVEKFYDALLHEFNPITSSDKGVALLHGAPGTGKTSFLRQIIRVSKKRMIYLPPDMAHHLSSPQFVTFLANQCAGAVLVIEDAENILRTRESGGNSAMSNLLNVSDGLLGDALRLQIIATFNAELTEIDSALLRPGRLIAQMEFKTLSPDRTAGLVAALYGPDVQPAKPSMTIAEIYSMNDDLIREKKPEPAKFGFV